MNATYPTNFSAAFDDLIGGMGCHTVGSTWASIFLTSPEGHYASQASHRHAGSVVGSRPGIPRRWDGRRLLGSASDREPGRRVAGGAEQPRGERQGRDAAACVRTSTK